MPFGSCVFWNQHVKLQTSKGLSSTSNWPSECDLWFPSITLSMVLCLKYYIFFLESPGSLWNNFHVLPCKYRISKWYILHNTLKYIAIFHVCHCSFIHFLSKGCLQIVKPLLTFEVKFCLAFDNNWFWNIGDFWLLCQITLLVIWHVYKLQLTFSKNKTKVWRWKKWNKSIEMEELGQAKKLPSQN